ncbi:hypothetical protein BL248_23360 [Ralstonia solanacearum]|nr:hypothetical protein BL248_23360 [Ralstonia solanacearum]
MLGTLPSIDCSLKPVWHIALTIPTLAISTAISSNLPGLPLASLATSNVKATCCDEIGQCQTVLRHLLAHPEHCFSLCTQAIGGTCLNEGTI